ncbi:MAG: competence protein ComEC family protein [Cyclobacteriaceae bacterium]|jgi:competence protein ComEC|nr:competence protein ComEC family protein [Cyclobacteriaceae bacterium]
MVKWIPYAMVRLSAFFMAGILLAIYHPDWVSLAWAVPALLAAGLVFALGYAIRQKTRTWSSLLGLVGCLFMTLAGCTVLLLRTDRGDPRHVMHMAEDIHAYSANVIKAPEEKVKSWKVELAVGHVKTARGWQPVSGKFLLYISKAGWTQPLAFGDQLLVKGSPQRLSPPLNPGEFDFQRFLSFRNIYHQHFARPEEVLIVQHIHQKGFLYYAIRARQWASGQLRAHIARPQAFAIANALVLGVTDGLDNELQNAYAASGAMHVLAVSGLHVGIIYGLLLLLLKPLARFSWSRWVVACVSLACLWGYAFVTGLSPSVLRAVTMFSFIALARPLGWSTNIYNTLAASAFLLLLYNPYLIMSVGFQLSYLAVLGIVYLQRPLYRLWEAPNSLLDKTWQITCVSMAAQIATFSLGLLYFHQFPTYFLFSNLFVIPGSFVVLMGGILLLAVSWLPAVASAVGFLLEGSIQLLNAGVFWIEQLPFSLVNHVHITTFQCWLVMGMLAGLMILFHFKTIHGLTVAAACAVGFGLLQWQHFHQHVKIAQWVVYRVPGQGAMEFIEHGRSVFYADSVLAFDAERIRFHIRPNRVQSGVATVHHARPPATDFWIHVWNGKTILLLAQPPAKLPRVTPDYVVVGTDALAAWEDAVRLYPTATFILDSSHSPYRERTVLANAASRPAHIHSVLQHGAFVVTTQSHGTR